MASLEDTFMQRWRSFQVTEKLRDLIFHFHIYFASNILIALHCYVHLLSELLSFISVLVLN
jgi:hypothetical protein